MCSGEFVRGKVNLDSRKKYFATNDLLLEQVVLWTQKVHKITKEMAALSFLWLLSAISGLFVPKKYTLSNSGGLETSSYVFELKSSS